MCPPLARNRAGKKTKKPRSQVQYIASFFDGSRPFEQTHNTHRWFQFFTIRTLQWAWSLMRSAVSPNSRPHNSEWSLWPTTIRS
jgi:hypothetical protein